MKRLGYLLSIAGHALLLLVILHSEFRITIQPEPPRVVVVAIAEPPLPYYGPQGVPGGKSQATGAPAGSVASGASAIWPIGTDADRSPSRDALSLPAAGAFSLRSSPPGSFRLAPVGKSPDPWALPQGPGPAPRSLRYHANAYRPGAAASAAGPANGVFMLPFDVRERVVADWIEAVLARIERNWILPASARLSFAGRVEIALTIERQGRQSVHVIDDASVPEPLTRAALQAVEASLPLPPLPENVAGETFAFTFVFVYNG